VQWVRINGKCFLQHAVSSKVFKMDMAMRFGARPTCSRLVGSTKTRR
jgi:hypothetical protein